MAVAAHKPGSVIAAAAAAATAAVLTTRQPARCLACPTVQGATQHSARLAQLPAGRLTPAALPMVAPPGQVVAAQRASEFRSQQHVRGRDVAAACGSVYPQPLGGICTAAVAGLATHGCASDSSDPGTQMHLQHTCSWVPRTPGHCVGLDGSGGLALSLPARQTYPLSTRAAVL